MEERLEAPVNGPSTLGDPAGLLPKSARRHGGDLEPFGRPSAARRGRPGEWDMYKDRRADPPNTGSHAIH